MKTVERMGCAALLWAFLMVPQTFGDVKLPAIFGDNMVLQRAHAIPIWGSADPGESVTVTLGEQSQETQADRNGQWKVSLDPVGEAGAIELEIAASNTIHLKNVLVGDVWVCSGQSNMSFSVSRGNDAAAEIAAANFPTIRLFQVPTTVAGEPRHDTKGQWVECSPKTVGRFSAVGYFFGRDLQKMTGRPVGLIQSAVGGTPAEAWTSDSKLKSDPDFQPILDRWADILANPEKHQQQYERQLASWKERAEKAKAAGRRVPNRPRPPLGPNHRHRASGLFNGMISPLIPYAISGVIWYQGEGNAPRAYQYRELFPAMIRDWRERWGQGDFTFLFVQLANFRKKTDQPVESDWAELREAQTMTLALPKTGMAVTIDIGEANDIHPKNKQDVGHRLALAADAVTYGNKRVYSGPTLRSITIENDRIRIHFQHVGGGLKVHGDKLTGFAIAGDDRKFDWADAHIDGDTVVVHSKNVTNPIAVRYGWANNPDCNLYNAEGLPASPFRTDLWPGVTVNAR